jgi:hypothetical protein
LVIFAPTLQLNGDFTSSFLTMRFYPHFSNANEPFTHGFKIHQMTPG